MDFAEDVFGDLRAAGHQVARGTLGTRRPVNPSGGRWAALDVEARAPNFAEQEVVVVQQAASPPVASDARDVAQPKAWAPTNAGVADSRPLGAAVLARDAQRILEHGGVFVLFCQPRTDAGLVGPNDQSLDLTLWDLLPELARFRAERDHGEEITCVPDPIFDELQPFLSRATFNCTLAPVRPSDNWRVLAHNKYGRAVAGVLTTDEKLLPDRATARGWVFLLPQPEDVAGCVKVLLEQVVPRVAPRLFPTLDAGGWLCAHPYELPSVRRLQAEIEAVRDEADRRVGDLEEAIEQCRQEDGWMHALLSATGEELVDAVRAALDDLGARDVRKVDDGEEERTAGRRREDLQIWGEEQVVLVEVKGIVGLPKEASSLQVMKYLRPRMRMWKRLDVRGLSLINQQRTMPALERDNAGTFQPDVLLNAVEQECGLMTTIDLLRLVRSRRRWSWPAATVVPLLLSDGRVEPVPLHYQQVGVVDGFFDKAGVVVVVVSSEFAVGDTLAFRLPLDYEEEVAESIHHEDVAVSTAEASWRVGVKTALDRTDLRRGVAVYRVLPPPAI